MTFEAPTQEVWDAIVDAFRIHPGHVVNASRLAGHKVTPAYAKYAWENGWWNHPGCENMIPVRDVISAELAVARAIVARQAEASPDMVESAKLAAKDTVAAAIVDIGEVRTLEARTLQIAQKITLATLTASGIVAKVMPELNKRIAEAIMREKTLPAKELIRLHRQWSEITHLGITQAKVVSELRGRLLGDADMTIVHELNGMNGDFASEEAAWSELREGARLAERYSNHSHIDTVAASVNNDSDIDSDTDEFDPLAEYDDDDESLSYSDSDTEDEDDGDLSNELADADPDLDPDDETGESSESDDDEEFGSQYVRRRVRP